MEELGALVVLLLVGGKISWPFITVILTHLLYGPD